MLEYINGVASVKSDESVIKEKICDNLWHLWENIFSSSIRDIHVNHRVRRSLPQITRINTDVGAEMLITDSSDYSDVRIYKRRSLSKLR